MIIDKQKPEHAHIPHTLDTEVLLGVEPNGNGFITAPQELVDEALDLTDGELEITGWMQYKETLDKLRPERHKLKKRDPKKPKGFDRVVIAREIERRKQQGGM